VVGSELKVRSSLRRWAVRFILFAICGLGAIPPGAAGAAKEHASGGGTYLVEPGILSEFQFSESRVQCKVGHAVLGDGTVLQMWMFSTDVDSVAINAADHSVVIHGTMVSMVTLSPPNGPRANLSETVPFVAYGKDNGTLGAGVDFFSLTVVYTPTPGLDQADLFGTVATFAPFSGSIATGNVIVH
jgi:hypothetical protein